jgi:hypothetical protein
MPETSSRRLHAVALADTLEELSTEPDAVELPAGTAAALANVLTGHEVDPDTVAGLGDLGWALVATLAEVPAPVSTVTRSATVTILRQRARHADPVDGLPVDPSARRLRVV